MLYLIISYVLGFGTACGIGWYLFSGVNLRLPL